MDYPVINRNRNVIRLNYKGHNCLISYDGLTPSFRVDGENAKRYFDDFDVTPSSVGRGEANWINYLIKSIDEYHGINVESDEYMDYRERRSVRSLSLSLIESLSDITGDYKKSVEVIEESNMDFLHIASKKTQYFQEILEKDDVDYKFENLDRSFDLDDTTDHFDIARYMLCGDLLDSADVDLD